jgi:hypothetical protein
MAADPSDAPRRFQLALKFALLATMVAIIGLPINDLFVYFLLLIAVIVLAVSKVTSQRRFWMAAIVVVLAATAARLAIDVPRIEEGHNIFLPGGADNALMMRLPPDVYRAMAAEFDRAYPEAIRCQPKTSFCWQDSEPPKRVYAFSFDGIYDKPAYSRRVTGIDFSDPEWQRLGFVNELTYNWYTASKEDVSRGKRRRGVTGLLYPWHITMPHFVMFSFPAAYVGSQLCWRGTVLWEGSGESFTSLPHGGFACREVASGDVDKRIFGLAISPGAPLAMTLRPTTAIRLLQLFQPATALIVVVALLFLLLRWNPRRLVLPLTFIGLSLVVILASDATLLGGVRLFDGGDDGLVYDGWSRIMVQQLLSGDIVGALKGVEDVFYFTPGSRYLRSAEHLFFGETYFGYVSLLLLLPFLVFCLFRRFFTGRVALAITLIFIAVPVGMLFGSTFYLYVKFAAHGYGDSAAAILFLAGIVMLIGRRRGPGIHFASAFGAALLFAMAIFVRPNLAVGAAVLLGGAGLAALWQRQALRVAGLCIGFLPVFGMALHNWYYGGVFVLFSRHTQITAAMPMPPSAYLGAIVELLRLDPSGDVARGAWQLRWFLVGPSEMIAMIPLHALAFAVIIRVMLSGRYDGWLRLVAAATLGLYAPALFFIYARRYSMLAWLLTLLICSVWMRDEGLPWLDRRFPGFVASAHRHPIAVWLMSRLDGLARVAGMAPRRAISAA